MHLLIIITLYKNSKFNDRYNHKSFQCWSSDYLVDDTHIDFSIPSRFSKNVDIEVSANVGGFFCLFIFDIMGSHEIDWCQGNKNTCVYIGPT
jgi:hypothetical protein